ncbi:MAG: hypothetical protein AB7T49_08930 [Oligoflexales bacterium]
MPELLRKGHQDMTGTEGPLLKACLICLLVAGLSGCSSIAAGQKEETYLTVGNTVNNPEPLPNMTEIWLVQGADTEVSRTLAYRGWDYNHDGRIDMLEKTSSTGEVTDRFFDYDFDGKIDGEAESAITANHNP